jgi:predicted outer membrane repeat protein
MSGGGLYSLGVTSVLTRVSVLHNDCGSRGGGALFAASSWCYPVLVDCLFLGNSAVNQGGAIALTQTVDASFTRCTVAENSAPTGAAIFCAFGANADFVASIIAFNTTGGSVHCGDWGDTGTVGLNCCDVYGNEGGDFVECIAGEAGDPGCFAANPEFCGVIGSGNCHLQSDSPCAPGNHPNGHACGQIGVLPVGCEATAAARTTWSSLKRRY